MIKQMYKPNLSPNTYALGEYVGKYVKVKVKFNIENNENYKRIHIIKL